MSEATWQDRVVDQGAQRLDLPKSVLDGSSPDRAATLAAALVRLSRDQKAVDALQAELGNR